MREKRVIRRWFLLFGAGIVVLMLSGWHFFGGRQPVEFQCVLVNQRTDFERDEILEEQFASYLGLPPGAVSVCSDYQFSYAGMKYEGVNESSYEKFFFNWSAGAIDAMLVPESLYRFCAEELEGEYRFLDEMLETSFYEKLCESGIVCFHGTEPVGIRADGTTLSDKIQQREDDPVILLFPKEGKHPEAGVRFLEMVAGN